MQNKDNEFDGEVSSFFFHNEPSALFIISYLLGLKEEQIYYCPVQPEAWALEAFSPTRIQNLDQIHSEILFL